MPVTAHRRGQPASCWCCRHPRSSSGADTYSVSERSAGGRGAGAASLACCCCCVICDLHSSACNLSFERHRAWSGARTGVRRGFAQCTDASEEASERSVCGRGDTDPCALEFLRRSNCSLVTCDAILSLRPRGGEAPPQPRPSPAMHAATPLSARPPSASHRRWLQPLLRVTAVAHPRAPGPDQRLCPRGTAGALALRGRVRASRGRLA